jgi:hypothetical protein
MPETVGMPPLELLRHENFENWYANNVQFYQSEWDLKLVFGQLDWRNDHFAVEQHTGITMAWLQAKLLLHYLSIQVGVYELSHGKIPIPAGALPSDPIPPTPEQAKEPFINQMYEYMKKRQEEFLAELRSQ